MCIGITGPEELGTLVFIYVECAVHFFFSFLSKITYHFRFNLELTDLL